MTPFERPESVSPALMCALPKPEWLRILFRCAGDLRALADSGAANRASVCPLA